MKPARILLAGAALVAGFAVAWTLTRTNSPTMPGSEVAASASGAADPLAALEQAARDNPQDIGAQRALGAGYFEQVHGTGRYPGNDRSASARIRNEVHIRQIAHNNVRAVLD